MKKTITLIGTLVLMAAPVVAQRVTTDNFDRLKVHYTQPRLTTEQADGYLTLSAPEYTLGGEIGAPSLPVLNSLIVVPFCEAMEVSIENAVYDTLTLPVGQVMPLQASPCKSHETTSFAIDESIYATDAFYGRPLASVEYLGTARDRNYAMLTYAPVSINPVTGQMVVCRSADITVHYIGSDAGATMKHFERYHTPAFSLGETLNTLFTNAKDVRTTAPIRMVIVVPRMLQCTALEEFADWKRQQGMMVDFQYVENNATSSSIASGLQQLFNEATTDAPAPTYLILVGDHGQLPAFPSDLASNNEMHGFGYQLDDHVTDLYFVTWTVGDKLPDCYQGRFSATDTATLRTIIDKTLYYERYQFADDSYLGRATLVAGKDKGTRQTSGYSADNAWIYSDPSMDYIAKFYINADHGYNTLIYFKNDTNQAPAGVTVTGSSVYWRAGQTLRSYYNTGMGWINYSAHGDWDEWSSPEFTVSQVRVMTNNDMPSFMIGNCCLSNEFDRGVCFGEALLRKENRAGAIGYIGATNSTFWGEDFYWSVGVRNNITHDMTLEYDANRMGMYDCLFHTHNESLSDRVATAGQILMVGNMSVQRQSGTSSWATSVAEYYWEIYELMGDPSLMPWLGTARNLYLSAVYQDNTVVVNSVPGAYVAVLSADEHELVAAAFADASGEAALAVPSTFTFDNNYLLSVTAQGYKPFLMGLYDVSVGIGNVAVEEVSVSPNPASGRCQVSAEGLHRVVLMNLMGQTLNTYRAADGQCTVSLDGIPAGLYLLRFEKADGISVQKLVVR